MNVDPFKEYLKEKEPNKKERGYAWYTAIGLQKVDIDSKKVDIGNNKVDIETLKISSTIRKKLLFYSMLFQIMSFLEETM